MTNTKVTCKSPKVKSLNVIFGKVLPNNKFSEIYYIISSLKNEIRNGNFLREIRTGLSQDSNLESLNTVNRQS